MALNLKILWLTVFRALKREGIQTEGHAAMSKFEGPREASDEL